MKNNDAQTHVKGVNTIARKAKLDWNAIKAEYIGGGISQHDLAQKYKVSYTSIRKHSDSEGWMALKKKAKQKSSEKAIQKTANAAAQNAVKLEKARGLLIDQILRAIEGMPKNGGTHVRQSQADKATGRQMTIDYDVQTLINALEKLSNGATADVERQKRFMEENNQTMISYADLFSRPARRRTIEELEGGSDV